jgi:alkylhydroperoxidase family enzyme
MTGDVLMARINDDLAALGSSAKTTWGHYQPEMARVAGEMSLTVYQNTALSLREAEAARFQTALLNGCNACYNYRRQRPMWEPIAAQRRTRRCMPPSRPAICQT